jgi:hypothetical protein
MGVRRAVLAAFVTVGVLAVPSGAAQPPALPGAGHEPAGFWSRLAAQGQQADPARAWRESTVDLLKRRTPLAEVETTAPAKTLTFDDAGLAGDLDGDRRADVAVLSQTYRIDGDGPWTTDHIDVEARRGATGGRLWSARVTPPKPVCEHECGEMFAYTGAYTAMVDGAPGIEVVSVSEVFDAVRATVPFIGFPGSVDPSYLFTFDVIHVDRHGRVRPLRHLEGRLRYNQYLLRAEHLPLVEGASPSLATGPEDDWAYLEVDGAFVQVGGRSVDRTTTVVKTIDGRTGALRQVASRGASFQQEDLDIVTDVTGDRVDDVALRPAWTFDAPSQGSRTPVTLLSTATGATLWTRPAGNGNVYLVPVGDTTGDRTADVIVYTAPFPTEKDPHPIPAVLVDGRTGRPLWQRTVDDAWSLGDVNHDGRDEVVTATATRSGRTARLDVAAYDGRNHRAYAHQLVVTGETGAHTIAAAVSDAGDLNGDGVEDVEVGPITRFTVTTPNSTSTTTRFVPLANLSGRTGAALLRTAGSMSLYDSVDGQGDDLLVLAKTGARIKDGRTGRSLLYVGFGIPAGFAWVDPSRIDRDGCEDLFVVAYTGSGLVFGVVSGATGRTVWQATRGSAGHARITASGRAYRCH